MIPLVEELPLNEVVVSFSSLPGHLGLPPFFAEA